VLTLPVNEREGHLPYPSQSDNPTKGTTVGERTDDPRRERTRDAPACHRARAGARQRQRGVSELGISRTIFYRWRKRLERYGVDGVHPRRQRVQPGRPVQITPEVERLVLGIAISAATWGCRRIAAYLARTWRVRLAPSTVQRLRRRVGLATRRARLTVLEQQAARTAGLLTDRTRQRLWRARYGHTRHVAANEPGELVCLDTFYIGNLKGVGKVWQVTACDAATSYGLAALLPAHDAAAAAAFLRELVVPHYQRAGWPVRRVLTDGGPEFKGAFDVACRQLGIRHTRTKPRHAWTNGFVERLQGTILQEHWRVAFRRHYFTSRAALQRALDAFMRYYNTERPHQGYRVRGRTPAALVWGVAAQ
jgi:transposase InsO family protein